MSQETQAIRTFIILQCMSWPLDVKSETVDVTPTSKLNDLKIKLD